MYSYTLLLHLALLSTLIYVILVILKFSTKLIPPPLRLKTEKEQKEDFELIKNTVGEEAAKKLEIVKENPKFKTYLIITAHPDDEIMFFAPTIIGLKKQQFKVKLLCLSTGNYDKRGDVREVEIKKCGKVVGINEEDITVLNHPGLQDNPDEFWLPPAVSRVISDYITPDITAVITFDKMGVSGHLNHRSIFEGLKYYIGKNNSKTIPAIYTLKSVSVIRKYLSVVDTIFSLNALIIPHTGSVGDTALFVSTISEVNKAQKAMLEYKSQMVWFRWLYILFSRYMIINELVRINP